MADSVKHLLEVYEVVGQIGLVLYALLYDDSTITDLSYCAPAWSKTRLFFWQQFLSPGHEWADGNSEHDVSGMADWADGTIVLILLEVVFLW